VARSKDGGHEAPVEAQALVSHRVDALVDAMELASVDSVTYSPCTQTGAFELPPRHHNVLPRGDPRHLRIGCVAFLTHVGT
jgi:hypothetical protein